MPFKSEKQRRYLWLKEPKVAKEFAKHTPKRKLPMRVKKKNTKKEVPMKKKTLSEAIDVSKLTPEQKTYLKTEYKRNGETQEEIEEGFGEWLIASYNDPATCLKALDKKLYDDALNGYFDAVGLVKVDELYYDVEIVEEALEKMKKKKLKKKSVNEAVEVDVDTLTDEQEAEVLAELVGYTDDQLEEKFDENLDDSYGECEVAGMKFQTSSTLKELDETAYRTSFNDWLDGLISDEDLVEVGGTYFKRPDIEEYFESKEEEEVETPVEKDEPVEKNTNESRTNTLTEGSMDLYVKCLEKQRM